MPLDLHGAEVVQITVGGRSIALANISIVGCVGVAASADASTFPLNTPVLIAGSEDAKREDLGTFAAGDTLHQTDGILFEATNPVCVYVRHEARVDPDDHAAKAAEAVDALLQARELTGYKPRILIAPGVSYETAVMTELKSTAERLCAMVYAEAGEPFISPPVPAASVLGDEQNLFRGADEATAEAFRDTYATANAAWLATYDADATRVIKLVYAATPTAMTVQYQNRVANAWADVGAAQTVNRTVGPGDATDARGLAGAIPSAPANPSWYGSATSGRVMLYHPWALGAMGSVIPPSPYVAAVRSHLDNTRGWQWSISNQPLSAWPGVSPIVDFEFGERASLANVLNQANVATIVRPLLASWRTWGNRVTDGSDPKFIFESVRRAIDVTNDSILVGHLWAVDQPIVTRGVVQHVVESVNGFLSSLVQRRRIVGGVCEANVELNTPANIEQGKLFFDFKVTPAYPAEQITFRSIVTPEYLQTIFNP